VLKNDGKENMKYFSGFEHIKCFCLIFFFMKY